MSKDFDAERTAQIDPSLREFTIGGHEFTVRVATAPEIYTRYWDGLRSSSSPAALDVALAALTEIAGGSENSAEVAREAQKAAALLRSQPDLSNADFLAMLDDTVLALIIPEQASEWADVRANADPPITIRTINQVVDYCMAVQNGRDPTESNSSSNGSPPRTPGLKSTDASDSPAAKASTT